ncbi:hypothetical protein [Streptomyces sp. NPDC001404]|uniref:hypothetical protein n=1 Tax=Streptomyces sp. NPDC001404 TaxID=3364571 RepID=UPI00367E9FC5
MSIVATALLGFEGAQITQIQSLPDMWIEFRWAGFASMALSAFILFNCLLNLMITDFLLEKICTCSEPKAWRKRRNSELAMTNTKSLFTLKLKTEEEALSTLLNNERRMVDDNQTYLIARRRKAVHAAVFLYVISLLALFIGLQVGP